VSSPAGRVPRGRAALYCNDRRSGARPEEAAIKDEDRELFRAAVRDVRPLGQPKRAPEREKRRPRAISRRADEAAVLADSLRLDASDLDVESGDELAFRREGVGESVLRRLRRGEYAVRDEIDLHGMQGFPGQASSWMVLPIGDEPDGKVTVTWPSGLVTDTDVSAGQRIEIVEPTR